MRIKYILYIIYSLIALLVLLDQVEYFDSMLGGDYPVKELSITTAQKLLALAIAFVLLALFFYCRERILVRSYRYSASFGALMLSLLFLFTAGHEVTVVSCGHGCPTYQIAEDFICISYREALIINTAAGESGNAAEFDKVIRVNEDSLPPGRSAIDNYQDKLFTRTYLFGRGETFTVYRGMGFGFNLADESSAQ